LLFPKIPFALAIGYTLVIYVVCASTVGPLKGVGLLLLGTWEDN